MDSYVQFNDQGDVVAVVKSNKPVSEGRDYVKVEGRVRGILGKKFDKQKKEFFHKKDGKLSAIKLDKKLEFVKAGKR